MSLVIPLLSPLKGSMSRFDEPWFSMQATTIEVIVFITEASQKSNGT